MNLFFIYFLLKVTFLLVRSKKTCCVMLGKKDSVTNYRRIPKVTESRRALIFEITRPRALAWWGGGGYFGEALIWDCKKG